MLQAPGSGEYAQYRQKAKELLNYVYRQDPFFAPHAEILFERKEVLGQGGMAVVCRVTDPRLKRDAALKMLSQKALHSDDIARFVREAQITAQLGHPGIPSIFEMGRTANGAHYILMEVIEGQSLRELIIDFHQNPKTTLTLGELLEVLLKASEAMAFAHSQQVLHRDLKPANIMVGRHGEVKVVDWGLAKEVGRPDDEFLQKLGVQAKEELEKSGLTMTGAVLGTPAYMSPEQVQGQDLDDRADVYALGAVLTEILTAKSPTAGETRMDCFIKTIKNEIELPRDRDPSAPKFLHELAQDALEYDRDDRLATAEEFAQRLKTYLRSGSPEGSAGRSKSPWLLVAALLVTQVMTGLWALSAGGGDRQGRFMVAREALLMGAPKDSVKDLFQATRGGSDNYHGAMLAGQLSQDSLTNAQSFFHEALAARPKDRLASLELIRLEWRQRRELDFQPGKVLTWALSEEAEWPKDSSLAWAQKGALALRAGQQSKALEAFSNALDRGPRLLWLRFLRARLWVKAGDVDRAAADLVTVIEQEPEFFWARCLLVEVLLKQGQAAKARVHVWRLRSQFPESVEVLELALAVERALSEPAGTLSCLNALVKIEDREAFLRMRAEIGGQWSVQDLVRRDWQALMAKHPKDRELKMEYARACLRAREWTLVVRLATGLIGEDASVAEVYWLRGQALVALGRETAARQDFFQAEQKGFDGTQAKLMVARSFWAESPDKFQEAARSLEGLSLDLASLSAQEFADLGGIYQRSGNSQKALLYLNAALKKDPDLAQGWGYKGLALVGTKRIEEALFHIKKALELDDSNYLWWTLRGFVEVQQGQKQLGSRSLKRALELADSDVPERARIEQALQQLR